MAVIAGQLDDPPTVATIADRLGVSRFALQRAFRSETGYTVRGFVRQLRVRAALDRLPESRGRLTDLALSLGFFDQSHFSRAFSREFGIAPSRLVRRAM